MERLKENEIAFNVWLALGFPSFPMLGEALGKSASTIKTWSARHKWAEQKDKWLGDSRGKTSTDDGDVNQKTLDQLIDESIQKIETGQIMVKTPKDILYLEEIRKSRMEAQEATSLTNLGALVNTLAESLIQAGVSRWEDIPDPDLEGGSHEESDATTNIEEGSTVDQEIGAILER